MERKQSKKRRPAWRDPRGNMLTAGGILFYDDDGIWVIGEMEKGTTVYTDMGGKYEFEDCSIYGTITRELREETYDMCEITVKQLKALAKSSVPVYVNGHHGQPVYICYPVHLRTLSEVGVEIKFDDSEFKRSRLETIFTNPTIPPHFYNSIEIRHIKFEDIENEKFPLSFRLQRIMRYSLLNKFVPKYLKKYSIKRSEMRKEAIPDPSSLEKVAFLSERIVRSMVI